MLKECLWSFFSVLLYKDRRSGMGSTLIFMPCDWDCSNISLLSLFRQFESGSLEMNALIFDDFGFIQTGIIIYLFLLVHQQLFAQVLC